ncbi:MAG: hypothetical protein U0Z44_04800 [Kouleothrix sp.]
MVSALAADRLESAAGPDRAGEQAGAALPALVYQPDRRATERLQRRGGARAAPLLAEAYIDLGSGGCGGRCRRRLPAAPPTAGPAAASPLPQAAARPKRACWRWYGRALPPSRPRFPDLGFGTIEPQLRLHEQVSAHWPLGRASLRQRVVALVNKLVRRYLRWYINPIVEQQNAARNAAITAALLAGMHLDAGLQAEVASLPGQGSGQVADSGGYLT